MPESLSPKLTLMNQLSPIVFHRSFTLVLLAGCSWANVTLAQNGADPASPVPGIVPPPAATEVVPPVPADTTGTGLPATGVKKAGDAGGTPAVEQLEGGKVKSPFRFGEPDVTEPGSQRPSLSRKRSGSTGSSSSRTLSRRNLSDSEQPPEESATKLDAEQRSEAQPTSFVAQGLYGQGQQILTPGQGRLAQPRFRYGLSVANGYDDNTFQTPDVSIAPVAQPRQGSGFTTVSGHWDVQWAKPRTVFTLDVNLGATFYWNRDRHSEDYNNRLAMVIVHRIDPRTQVTANVNFSYLSQPDYSNVFASQSAVGGDYITTSTKFDLLHRWAPHFSTNTSVALDLLYYTQSSSGGLSNSYLNYTFGNEFRFSSSPRLTWILEGRYSLQDYIDNSALNSGTAFFLGGVDWIWSRRLTTSVRAGAALRSFDSGGSTTDPYLELSARYQTSRRSSLSVNTRYGYEQQNFVGNRDISYRLGLAYQHALTYRLSGDLGFNLIHTDSTPATGAGSSTNTYDFNAGLQYRLNRHLSLGARYFYTQLNSSTGLQDYNRNRVLFSADYEF